MEVTFLFCPLKLFIGLIKIVTFNKNSLHSEAYDGLQF